MKGKDQALLDLIEADYRSNHTQWIERSLNKHFARWFRHKIIVEIDDLLAERQISKLQIEVFSYYHKVNCEPVAKLSLAAYEKWITTITMGRLTREGVSCWSKIKIASASNGR